MKKKRKIKKIILFIVILLLIFNTVIFILNKIYDDKNKEHYIELPFNYIDTYDIKNSYSKLKEFIFDDYEYKGVIRWTYPINSSADYEKIESYGGSIPEYEFDFEKYTYIISLGYKLERVLYNDELLDKDSSYSDVDVYRKSDKDSYYYTVRFDNSCFYEDKVFLYSVDKINLTISKPDICYLN